MMRILTRMSIIVAEAASSICHAAFFSGSEEKPRYTWPGVCDSTYSERQWDRAANHRIVT